VATYDKRVAFIVTDEYEGRADVFWARSHAEARRAGAGEFGLEFADVTCRRVPRYDNGVTMQMRIDDGWHWECLGPSCQRVVDADTDGMLIEGERVYCSQRCRDEDTKRRASLKRAEDAARSEVLRMRPDATIESLFLNVANEAIVSLKLPSGRHVTCSLDWLASDEGKSA
jgi:hypothetical protein